MIYKFPESRVWNFDGFCSVYPGKYYDPTWIKTSKADPYIYNVDPDQVPGKPITKFLYQCQCAAPPPVVGFFSKANPSFYHNWLGKPQKKVQKSSFLSGPATKAFSPPPPRLSGHRNFFLTFKKNYFFSLVAQQENFFCDFP